LRPTGFHPDPALVPATVSAGVAPDRSRRRRGNGDAIGFGPVADLKPPGARDNINAPSSARTKVDRIVYGEFRNEDP